MGAASRGGGAVTKGPKNKMLSEPSMKTPKVLMMAKGGDVNINQHKRMAMGMMGGGAVRGYKKGGKVVQKFAGGGLLAPPGAPPPDYRSIRAVGKMGGTIGKNLGSYLASKFIPGVKELGAIRQTASDLKRDYDAAMLDEAYGQGQRAQAFEQELNPVEYRRGGEVRRKMRKGGMADKKGRAMKRKSFDARGRAMKGK